MSDDLDKDKLELDGGAPPAEGAAPEASPWAKAFATLEEQPAAGAPDAAQVPPVDDSRTPGAAPGSDSGGQPQDAGVGVGDAGGSVPGGAEPGADDGEGTVDVEAAVAQYAETAEKRAITETAQLFLDRADPQGRKLIRQTDGVLGATINDPDVYRVDPDTGVPTFYNPDTGKPFTGDNPRAQAKAWVEGYNDELRDTFNKFAVAKQTEIETEMAPAVELLKFIPVYDKLDPVRQQMFDALVEGYEVYDSANEHIGYSVDLAQALERVNKQVAALQASRAGAPAVPKVPTGPALDMPTTGGAAANRGEIDSLTSAMEATQDAQLAKLRAGKR